MNKCVNCRKHSRLISKILQTCVQCIRKIFSKVFPLIQRTQIKSCMEFDLSTKPPKNWNGVQWNLCIIECKIPEGESGFCGLRRNLGGKFQNRGKDEGNLTGIMILSPPISHDASGIGIPEAQSIGISPACSEFMRLIPMHLLANPLRTKNPHFSMGLSV